MPAFDTVERETQIDNKPEKLMFRRLSPEQMEANVRKFLLEDILDKNHYVPKVVGTCLWRGGKNREFSYEDMVRLYEASIEVNPKLRYESVSKGINIKLNFGADSGESHAENTNSQLQTAKMLPDGRAAKKDITFEERFSEVDFRELEERLNEEEVMGQKDAIRQVLKPLINTKHRGMPKKGIPSLYLTGPSGVGKTSLAEILAEILEVPLLYLQGSEYQERHTVRNLFGAPVSYVGYDEKEPGGLLTHAIRRDPYSIFLFDEMDKVHPKVYEALTSFLWDGFLITPPKGERYDFKGYFIFTSNTGNKLSEQSMGRLIGFEANSGLSENEAEKNRIISILEQQGISRPFLGRISEFVNFNALDEDTLDKILNKNIGEANGQLKYYNINVNDEAKEEIIRRGNPSKFGAREVYNNLNRFVVSELNYEFEMNNSIVEGSVVQVDFKDDEFRYSIPKEDFLLVKSVASS
ncbi:MAG: AAA family ATPase [Candidatus Woesearchaeota archaeon]|jgi:ATP-dependent Clp protease ATP-binding subunit ClpA|nr:AAA family ATPase [Candidatus Woesearchaeota archaeon]|tara:strand:- start:11129 stop:12526 length:1398 start_codon:yes stop_codon:yes gene_type:complete